MFELCASILAANFACLKREVRAAESAGGDVSYIDIMDGHFVSAISFGTGIVRTMGRLDPKAARCALDGGKSAAFYTGTGRRRRESEFSHIRSRVEKAILPKPQDGFCFATKTNGALGKLCSS